MRPAWWMAAVVSACAVLAGHARAAGPDLEQVLTQVGERVRTYYERAQSVVATETVRLRPYASISGERRLAYELRIAWEATTSPGETPKADVVRRLLTVNGRPPRPKDEAGCMDPKGVSPEPLSLLLPEHRAENVFSLAGTGRTDGRAAILVDYKPATRGKAEVSWHDDCVSVSLPGRTQGRVWLDAATGDILRIDEHLMGQFDVDVPPENTRATVRSMVLERADSSIHYKPVAFHEPDETLMLPSSIESLTVFRGSGVPMLRIEQRFTDYKRFLGESHLVFE